MAMRRTALALGTLLGALGAASAAGAHPGHGVAPDGFLHWATEPVHAAPLALLVLTVGLAWRRRARARLPRR
jgi:hypothetical protein